jgi:hypothetical protein
LAASAVWLAAAAGLLFDGAVLSAFFCGEEALWTEKAAPASIRNKTTNIAPNLANGTTFLKKSNWPKLSHEGGIETLRR